jgi:predicted nucleic acid-binding protein
MAKVVVDSSVAIKWFVAEPHSDEARLVLDAYRAGMLDLIAPDLIHAEVGNIAWKLHAIKGMVAADAQSIVDAFQALPLGLTSTAILLTDAYRLAVAHKRSVYDALYVALCLREQCPFVTADEKLWPRPAP